MAIVFAESRKLLPIISCGLAVSGFGSFHHLPAHLHFSFLHCRAQHTHECVHAEFGHLLRSTNEFGDSQTIERVQRSFLSIVNCFRLMYMRTSTQRDTKKANGSRSNGWLCLPYWVAIFISTTQAQRFFLAVRLQVEMLEL